MKGVVEQFHKEVKAKVGQPANPVNTKLEEKKLWVTK